MRKSHEELELIKKKYNVSSIWSWSKYNTYKNSPYEYYLKYIKKIKEDRRDSIYAQSGSTVHKILEDLYLDKIKYEEMLEEYENQLLTFNLAELKYDRTDEEKNNKIAQKYEYCMRHFFQHYNLVQRKVEVERFVTVLINKNLFQCYIDFLYKENGVLNVVDFKTSTIYTGKKIEKEGGQLILYSEAIRQLGFPLENIKAKWCFLKYVTIEVPQANGKIAVRNIERSDIGNSLASNVKMWMKKEKYSEEDIDGYVSMLCEINDLSCLPENIQSKYIVKDCYVEVPLSEEIIDNLKKDIHETLVEINKKELEYIKTKDENIWWEEVTKEKSYYFANLCSYSGFLHKPYGKYLEELNMFRDEKKEEDEDLSWLENLG